MMRNCNGELNSMAPRIPEYPVHRVSKVAFMLLTKGSVHLVPLCEKFFIGALYSLFMFIIRF